MNDKLLLSGVKVIELATFVAAPACGRLMADNGAEVIKVESVPYGCPWRYANISAEFKNKELHNPAFDYYNSNKKSIALDLKTKEGMKIFHKLLEDADVLITNTRARSLKKLGLDYDTLKVKYPKLVYAFLAGYGEKGPLADAPAFDAVAFWADTGFLADMPNKGDYPLTNPIAMGDISTGTTLFGGVCAALLKRCRTGIGEKVTASLLGTGIWMTSMIVGMNQPGYGNKIPKSRLEQFAGTGSYLCKDDEWVFIAIADVQYESLREVLFNTLGLSELLDDSKFNTYADVCKNSSDLIKAFEKKFLEEDSQYWIEAFGKENIIITRLGHFSEVVNNEQVLANEYMFKHTYRDGSEFYFPNTPIITDGVDQLPREYAPLLGEQTEEIMLTLGYNQADIALFTDSKILIKHK